MFFIYVLGIVPFVLFNSTRVNFVNVLDKGTNTKIVVVDFEWYTDYLLVWYTAGCWSSEFDPRFECEFFTNFSLMNTYSSLLEHVYPCYVCIAMNVLLGDLFCLFISNLLKSYLCSSEIFIEIASTFSYYLL